MAKDQIIIKGAREHNLKNVDLTIRPYNWVIQEGTKNEKSGVKATCVRCTWSSKRMSSREVRRRRVSGGVRPMRGRR